MTDVQIIQSTTGRILCIHTGSEAIRKSPNFRPNYVDAFRAIWPNRNNIMFHAMPRETRFGNVISHEPEDTVIP